MSALNVVWKEAYEQSYESSSFYTEEFKRDYQKSFVEALWMYRHPIVYDPISQNCIHVPAQITDDYDDTMGDRELLHRCLEYSELASNPIRIMQVVGEVPPTQEECISIAEGRTHVQWKLRKPTPIYEDNTSFKNMDAPQENGRAHEQNSRSKVNSSMKKRKSSTPSTSNHRKKSSVTAFQSKRVNRHLDHGEKENNSVAPLVSSTQSDRRRSLDGDEIACVAAGGFKKDDQRPKNANKVFQSRNLFPGELLCTSEETPQQENDNVAPETRSTLPVCDESPSHESAMTVPLSATPAKGKHRGSNNHQEDRETRSPNLLASTTPELSTQSSSKATLSLTASGTQSSSKATTQTLSQSQSSSKASVHQTQDFATQTQWETPILKVRTGNAYETPVMHAESQLQTPNFSTQEEHFETQATLDSFQTP